MRAAAGAARAGVLVLCAGVGLGFVVPLALAAAAYAQDPTAEVLRSLAEQQVIVTQALDGGYEVDYADAGPSAFEGTRARLDGLSPIVRLRIANDDTLKHLYLDGLTELQHLELANNASLRSINGLEDLTRLQTLAISNNDRLKDEIEAFTGLGALQTLKVVGNYRLRVLPDLAPLGGLRDLEIVGNERLGALTGFESLR
jgi:Leucine-rich repeat (LRR) protein